jgi:enoyl-CoA hydratase/carnithine racemase
VEYFETVIFKKIGSIAYITLNRPNVLNVYNTKMRDELYQVLSAIKDDDEIRAVVLKGAGERAFCAGADLSEFLTAPTPIIARQVRWERDLWGLFLNCPSPIIAALHGYVLGDGIEMALCCDIRIASDDAQFGLPELGLGIIPAAGGTQTLPRIVGQAKALEMIYTGNRINAKEAYAIGLVNRVVPNNDLYPTASAIANQIARVDPRVISSIKYAVIRGIELSITDGLKLERIMAQKLLLNV